MVVPYKRSNKLAVDARAIREIGAAAKPNKTKLWAGQEKSRPSRSDKPLSWGLASSVQRLCLSLAMAMLSCRATCYNTQMFLPR